MTDTQQPQPQISLFKNPILTLGILIRLIINLIFQGLQALKNKFILIPLITILTLFILFPPVWKVTWFILFWVLTGVASSIGLGTGLHTFVLYLLPHVASVITASLNCNGMVPPMLPSRYDFQHFGKCSQSPIQNRWLGIIWAFIFESILWGFGSALGELPPYFIARQAALGKQQQISVDDGLNHEEEQREALTELSKQEGVAQTSEYIKNLIINSLKNHGFITILFLASIPNPFFDLAGLACGHFGIPLRTFFSATLIGKTFIKVHIQIVMVLFLLSEQFLKIALKIIDEYYPKLHPLIVSFVEEQKGKMFQHSESKSSWLETIWSFTITAMIAYFVISVIDTVVQRHYQKNRDQYEGV